jgi:hypothetical protein
MPASKSRAAMKGMKAKRVSTRVGRARAARVPAQKKKAEAARQELTSHIVRVVHCSNLMTGMTAELNLLSGGNGHYFIGENGNGERLKEGAIYDVRMSFISLPADSSDEDYDDGFSPHGTVWWAKEVSKGRYKKLLKHKDLSMNIDSEED